MTNTAMTNTAMTNLDAIRQADLEKALLQYLIEGLRNTFAWQTQGHDVSRKLSTLKFIMRSFQRHLERLMDLEEQDGYMEDVLEKCPYMAKDVEGLRRQHDEFRRRLRLLTRKMTRISPIDQNSLNHVCERAAAVLKKVDEHHRKETDLFQEALERELGGEG